MAQYQIPRDEAAVARVTQALRRNSAAMAALNRGDLAGAENVLRVAGIDIPPGYKLNARGGLDYVAVDNRTHWYDPQYLAPIVVGATGGLAALAGGPAAAAGGGAGATTAATGPVGGIPLAYTAGATVPNAAALGTSAGAGGASALSRILGGLNTANNTANTVTNAAGKSSLLDKILQGAGLGVAGFNAINSFRNPPANEQLNRILGLSEQRINDSAPLFKALNTMALAGLPRYTRGE